MIANLFLTICIILLSPFFQSCSCSNSVNIITAEPSSGSPIDTPLVGPNRGAPSTHWGSWGHTATTSMESNFNRTLYVNQAAGNNGNSGLSDQEPLATIQMAATIAQPGDRILISDGIYRETITLANSGSIGLPIIFEGQSIENTIITGADNIAQLQLGTGVELTGLTSKGFETNAHNFEFNGLTVDSGNTLTLDNTEFAHGRSSVLSSFGGDNRGARMNLQIPSGSQISLRTYFKINSAFNLAATGQTFEWLNLKHNYISSTTPFLRFGFRADIAGNISLWSRLDLPGPINTVIYNGVAGEISKDQWHYVEVRYFGNEPTTGGVALYLNGNLLGERRNLNTTDPLVATFDRIELGGNTTGGTRPTLGSLF